jgi:hypothetical protein
MADAALRFPGEKPEPSHLLRREIHQAIEVSVVLRREGVHHRRVLELHDRERDLVVGDLLVALHTHLDAPDIHEHPGIGSGADEGDDFRGIGQRMLERIQEGSFRLIRGGIPEIPPCRAAVVEVSSGEILAVNQSEQRRERGVRGRRRAAVAEHPGNGALVYGRSGIDARDRARPPRFSGVARGAGHVLVFGQALIEIDVPAEHLD